MYIHTLSGLYLTSVSNIIKNADKCLRAPTDSEEIERNALYCCCAWHPTGGASAAPAADAAGAAVTQRHISTGPSERQTLETHSQLLHIIGVHPSAVGYQRHLLPSTSGRSTRLLEPEMIFVVLRLFLG